MASTLWERYERCANLCADYKELFGENVPIDLIAFHDFDTISLVLEQAILTNTKICVKDNE